jgi:cation diffusion facilitator CzcD-associated flavoprotein CzcO
MAERDPVHGRYDVVVVGAGFAGLYLHHLLRGQGRQVIGFDAADDVGGTWWWNRYPGARCDIESWDYSYSFSPELEQEWDWSERYAAQPEILRYLNHVADRFDLRRGIRFATRVVGARWDSKASEWMVTTDRGDEVRAQFVIMAIGCLSTATTPAIEGLESFAGRVLHTARWPHEPVDFQGQRVAVIGTGSSGVQSIPRIAEQAAHVTVFQRTPSFALPAHNRALTAAENARFKAQYRDHRRATRESRGGVITVPGEVPALTVSTQERAAAYANAWEQGDLFALLSCFNDLMIDQAANETVAEFIRERVRDVVADPVVADRLSPRTYPFGAKRACLDTGYYDTFNRPNVSLVDLRAEPITEVVAAGIRTAQHSYDIDTLVFATGFDAMTGPLLAIDPQGRDGVCLHEVWRGGADCYLGLMTAGFPNLFLITGPGSPSVLTNMVASIEQHVEWVCRCLSELAERGVASIEPALQAQTEWMEHVAQVADFTLYPQVESWYTGANIAGKPRRFMPYIGGLDVFRQVCDSVAADSYRGFVLTS